MVRFVLCYIAYKDLKKQMFIIQSSIKSLFPCTENCCLNVTIGYDAMLVLNCIISKKVDFSHNIKMGFVKCVPSSFNR